MKKMAAALLVTALLGCGVSEAAIRMPSSASSPRQDASDDMSGKGSDALANRARLSGKLRVVVPFRDKTLGEAMADGAENFEPDLAIVDGLSRTVGHAPFSMRGELSEKLMKKTITEPAAEEEPEGNGWDIWFSQVAALSPAKPSDDEGCTFRPTSSGILEGVKQDRVEVFRGIPYAEPPTGENRFAPPKPFEESWDGIRKASDFGPLFIQPGAKDVSEDALTLNIWMPADKDRDHLPVFVFVHGGGLSAGGGSLEVYDGAELARAGIVVVTLNYRLGTLGFMPTKAALAESGTAGNYGVMDVIEALRWVKAHIEDFGGDPKHVTLGGQSAGASIVSALLTSPEAKGLFSQAILESSSALSSPGMTPLYRKGFDGAIAAADKALSEIPIADDAEGLAGLRRLPAEKFLFIDAGEDGVTSPQTSGFWMVEDGKIIPKHFAGNVHQKDIHPVRILFGFNTDEDSIFIPETVTEADYKNMARSVLGDKADELLAAYPVDSAHSARQRMMALADAAIIRFGMYEYGNAAKAAYAYRFGGKDPLLAGTNLGTPHGAELKYFFRSCFGSIKKDPVQLGISNVFYYGLTNFIKYGDPNGYKGDEVWKPYSQDALAEFYFGETFGMEPVYEKEYLDFITRLMNGRS